MNNLFEIYNLCCSYADDKPILKVNKLEIERGKMIFILGASGCGKTTLLETLGLMKKTVVSGSVNFYPNDSNEFINLNSLWNKDKHSKINEIRKKHYSFIFQDTNLMENFTAYENACMPSMIKEDIEQESVIDSAIALMERMKLSQLEITKDTLAIELSGGQKQRLSFVAALTSKANVLFCDEPTGNLDEANAVELFEIIKERTENNGLSAIIVSHDINLALKFADKIVVITRRENFGEINPENIFEIKDRNNPSWKSDDIKKKILNLYNFESNYSSSSIQTRTSNFKIKYQKLFFKNEFAVLIGRKRSTKLMTLVANNLTALTFMFLFTYLALGFANGSLDYLKNKLNDPYVNWLTISIPYGHSKGKILRDLQKKIETDSIKQQFNISNTSLFKASALFIWKYKSKGSDDEGEFVNISGRSVDEKSDSVLLHEKILSKQYFVSGLTSGFKDENDIGVILTKSLLVDSLNYDSNAKFIYLKYDVLDLRTQKPKELKLPIQIRAVVNELPGTYKIIYPINFYATYADPKREVFNIENPSLPLSIFYSPIGKIVETEKLERLIDSVANHDSVISKFHPNVNIGLDEIVSYMNGTTYRIDFVRDDSGHLPSASTLDSFYTRIVNNFELVKYKCSFIRIYDFAMPNISAKDDDIDYDVMSVYFTDLKKVRAFAAKFGAIANGIDIDTTKITDKENFTYLSTILKAILWGLIGFSIISICLYVNDLLNMHLSKVKKNIGTYKAIGLENKHLIEIYVFITICFLVLAAVTGGLLAIPIGNFCNFLLGNIGLFEPGNYYSLNECDTYISVGLVILISFVFCTAKIYSFLSRSPGDLIFRDT